MSKKQSEKSKGLSDKDYEDIIKAHKETQDRLDNLRYTIEFQNTLKELNDAIDRNTKELSILSKRVESMEQKIECKKQKSEPSKKTTKSEVNKDEIKRMILKLKEEKAENEEKIMVDPSDEEKYESRIEEIDNEIENLEKLL